MKLQDYLHYYMGCTYWTSNSQGEVNKVTLQYVIDMIERDKGVQLHLRRLEDMTEEEMLTLLQLMVPDELEDKPINEEYGIEMFRNDGGNLVDANVLVGAEYSCRCYVGQITIKKCGTICAYDETGDEQELVNAPRAYHYLLRQHFDLFGLLDAGLAVDAKTITQ
jgi:hypothetical protein